MRTLVGQLSSWVGGGGADQHKKSSNNSHKRLSQNQPANYCHRMWQNKVLIIRTAHMLIRPWSTYPSTSVVQGSDSVRTAAANTGFFLSTWLDISLRPKYTTKLCSIRLNYVVYSYTLFFLIHLIPQVVAECLLYADKSNTSAKSHSIPANNNKLIKITTTISSTK